MQTQYSVGVSRHTESLVTLHQSNNWQPPLAHAEPASLRAQVSLLEASQHSASHQMPSAALHQQASPSHVCPAGQPPSGQHSPDSMHCDPHLVWAPGQVQAPLAHVCVAPQSVFWQQASAEIQPPLQGFFPVGQTHAPPTHSPRAPQSAVVQQWSDGMHVLPHLFFWPLHFFFLRFFLLASPSSAGKASRAARPPSAPSTWRRGVCDPISRARSSSCRASTRTSRDKLPPMPPVQPGAYILRGRAGESPRTRYGISPDGVRVPARAGRPSPSASPASRPTPARRRSRAPRWGSPASAG